jgi:hypothetical protein
MDDLRLCWDLGMLLWLAPMAIAVGRATWGRQWGAPW